MRGRAGERGEPANLCQNPVVSGINLIALKNARVAESGKPVVGGAVGFELLAQRIAWAAPHNAGAQPRGSSILLSRSASYSSRNSRTFVSRPDGRNQKRRYPGAGDCRSASQSP